MESLHTIAESLPGLLEGSPSAARAALLRDSGGSAKQEDYSNVSTAPGSNAVLLPVPSIWDECRIT